MSDARAIFWARLGLGLNLAGMVVAFVPCVMFIWKRNVFSTPWTVCTPLGIVLAWGSVFISVILTRRKLRQTQDRLIEVLQENLALKEGDLRLRLGDPGDHDHKGLLT